MYRIKEEDNFLLRFQESVKNNWYNPALTDYKSITRTFGDVANDIEKNRVLWKAAGLQKGDKIAINAKSCANWAVVYLSAQCAGYVAVVLFPGFTPSDTSNLVNHSDSRILYTEKSIFDSMDFEKMPNLLGVIDLVSGELLAHRTGFKEIYSIADGLFINEYPIGFEAKDVSYTAELDSLSSIMYTSGSTGNSKGVMLTIRNISSQVRMLPTKLPYKSGYNVVSILPFAHIFGMTVDMITPLCCGMHIVILGLPPIPNLLKPALRQYKPHSFFCVPLVLEKLVEDSFGEFIHSETGKAKLDDYKNNPDFTEALHTIFMSAMGGSLELLVTGGAAIPAFLEELLVEKLGLPFVTGYGMSETSPVISVGTVGSYKLGECGTFCQECVDLKIDSFDPENIPGEILVKGDSVFTGYYKNEQTTATAFTPDGWFRTGDLATLSKENSLFIVGRCKNLILTTNGQNIFPEEIEVILNELPGVSESLIVERNETLIALIVPDQNRLGGIDSAALSKIMDANLVALNKSIPSYCRVCGYELCFNPFEKTPKGSIKRFMYK